MSFSHVQLTWHDPLSNVLSRVIQRLPLIIGRDHSLNTINVPLRVLSGQHTRLFEQHGALIVEDLDSRNGTLVHGDRINRPTPLIADGLFQVGPVEFRAKFINLPAQPKGETILAFDPSSDRLRSPEALRPPSRTFPPAIFDQPIVPIAALPQDIEEKTYLAIGGGLGSFAWVDHLLVYGADSAEITCIGLESKPYGRYKRLCENSQIPEHERLRSNSDACPDNLWGWPGYAVREMWHETRRGNFYNAGKVGWHIFNEPFVETYTPKAGNVYASIDREAQRIGWDNIWRHGRVRAIRKTDDGRYVVAYSQPVRHGASRHKLIVTQHIHLAVGYPGVRFLPDLQRYRQITGDFERVVNAYEDHDHVYKGLKYHGGTVILRGRGIVASRILQKLYEIRQSSKMPIRVVHLMRSPLTSGKRYGSAERDIESHWEYQPFNWPKAVWGGDLRGQLESASDEERMALLKQWGGTTTADRRDWREIIQTGLREGWYEIKLGTVEMVERHVSGRVSSCVRHYQDENQRTELLTDYVIDATGLESGIKSNALLDDLVGMYQVKLNPQGRFAVTPEFEIEDLRNGDGRLFAAGVSTLGGPFAAVDSFLGLQYAAQRSADLLAKQKTTRLKHLNGLRSVNQWVRWARGVQP
ncbi:MAG: FHA domain-containing protein [Candidatus Promineifilaceae bacterium]